MKKYYIISFLCIFYTLAVAQEPATTGRVKMDIEVTDLAGVNAKTKLITLQNVKASEVEPFIRNRLTQYGTVQVNDVLNALVITELEPKLSDLIKFIKELDKRGVQNFLRLETEAISLNYVAPISIDSVLKTRLSPDGSIQIHSDLNMVIVTDVRSKIADIKEVIASLDIPPKQVVITGEVLEVNSEYSRKIGLNWHAFPEVFPSTLIDFSIEKGEKLNWSASGSLSPEVLIQRVKQCINEGKGKITSMPRIVVQNSRTGVVGIGGARRIMIDGMEGVEEASQERNELTLEVTPRIGKDAITLEINIWKGRYSNTSRSSSENRSHNKYGDENYENYNESTSRSVSGSGDILLSTTVLLRDGDAYVLASGQTKAKQTITTGIPVLKDIPLLGYLFKRKSDITITNDLIIFITPRILNFGEKLEK